MTIITTQIRNSESMFMEGEVHGWGKAF